MRDRQREALGKARDVQARESHNRETRSSRSHFPVPSSPSLQVFFKPWLGVQIHATCPLYLVRDTRKGEKPQDLQRRLKRFREQRPGGL